MKNLSKSLFKSFVCFQPKAVIRISAAFKFKNVQYRPLCSDVRPHELNDSFGLGLTCIDENFKSDRFHKRLQLKKSLVRGSISALCILCKISPPITVQHNTRNIARWVAPTLRELKRRQDRLEPPPPVNRATFIEWNVTSELFAFSKRLNENFNPELLQQAFTHRSYIIQEERKQQEVGIENPVTNLKDNTKLTRDGGDFLSTYVGMFISSQLSGLPRVGVESVRDYLLSDEVLANVSQHIGTKDLILSSDFPPDQQSLALTFKAIIGALNESSGKERTFEFIRDFLCTQLNQKDIEAMWIIDEPLQMLNDYCKTNNFGEPEPRLIGDAAKSTITPTYHVGIYCDRKMLGSGFGEDVNTAIEVAAINCLKKLYDIANPRPLNFKISLKELEDSLREKQVMKRNV